MKFFYTYTVLFLLTLISPQNILFSINTSWAENPKRFSINIIKRQVIEKKRLRVNLGDRVILSWYTDEDVKIHLHGYDIEKKVVKGRVTLMRVWANTTGRFPITSHGFEGEKKHSHGKGALLYLEVYPK